EMGMGLEDCVVYSPNRPDGGLAAAELRAATMILWRGHCSVHGRFAKASVDDVRARIPGVNVLVHPECRHEVVRSADYVGSTEYIIRMIDQAPSGSAWAVGTELNLVRRLAQRHPDKTVAFLDRTVCFCSTMNRIDLPHLVWSLESLARGEVVNQITVDPDTAAHARAALDRMLALPSGPAPRIPQERSAAVRAREVDSPSYRRRAFGRERGGHPCHGRVVRSGAGRALHIGQGSADTAAGRGAAPPHRAGAAAAAHPAG